MTATIFSFPQPGAGVPRRGPAHVGQAPAPRVRPLRSCLACGTLTTALWCSDRCWRHEDGGEHDGGEHHDGDDAA